MTLSALQVEICNVLKEHRGPEKDAAHVGTQNTHRSAMFAAADKEGSHKAG